LVWPQTTIFPISVSQEAWNTGLSHKHPTKNIFSQAPVAHTCNPRFSKSRNQEDWGSKPAQANSSQDPVSKKPNTKRAGGVAQGVGPEFKPSTTKNKKSLICLYF
jgi:hypothetical protein